MGVAGNRAFGWFYGESATCATESDTAVDQPLHFLFFKVSYTNAP